jgi:hypothetical protein
VSEPPEQPKKKDDERGPVLIVALMVFLMIAIPVAVVWYIFHKLSQIH